MKCTVLVHFKEDQLEGAPATNLEEAKKVMGAGFEYVAEESKIMLFRKPNGSQNAVDKR